MRKRNIHRYRLALYGTTGAGKTVFMAALAMDRINHHPDFSCTRVPLGEALKAPGGWSASKQKWREEALEEGNAWLSDALLNFRKGQMPPPNPPDHLDMIFEFDLSDGMRTYRLEFIDYAGELVHSSLSTTEKAKQLRTRLKDMDGLLVLAPAPWPEQDQLPLDEDLRALRETFMLLRDERGESALSIPVALLLNKWDRRSKLEYREPDNEHQELTEFLDQQPPPPHKDLLKALKSVVEDEESFEVFPVSALGECEKIVMEDGRLLDGPPPSLSPLYSFGLEDPLVWICQHCDIGELKKLETEVQSSVGGWLPWPFSLNGLRKGCVMLSKRIPQRDVRHQRAILLKKRCNTHYFTRWSSLVVLVIVVVMGMESTRDVIQYRKGMQIIESPASSMDDVQKAEAWFKDYAASPWYRHALSQLFLMDKKVAVELVKKIEKKWDDSHWHAVWTKINIRNQANLAREHLERFPNCEHEQEAEFLVDKNDSIIDYGQKIKTCRIVDAGNRLGQRMHPGKPEMNPNWVQQLADSFWEDVDEALFNGKCPSKVETCKELPQLPPVLMKMDARIPVLKKCDEVIDIDTNALDRELYNSVQKFRTVDSINNYLSKAPKTCMRKEVEDYRTYLDSLGGKHLFKLFWRDIEWASNVSKADDVEVTVYMNDNRIMRKSEVKSRPQTKTGVGLVYKFSRTLDDRIKLSAKAVDIDMFGDDFMGSGQKRVKIGHLCSNSQGEYTGKGLVWLPIKTLEFVNTLHFGLIGCPKAPELPPWKGCMNHG